MSLQLTEALKEHLKGLKLRLVNQNKNDDQFVFTNEEGKLIDKDNWRRESFL